MNRKKLLTYSLFFLGLIILFLFFVFWGTDNWKTKLPTLATVQPFAFTAEDGKTFTNRDMQGKVCVVNYFFTTCKGICPRMNGNMKKVYEEFKNQPDFIIVSHTSDPETDSAATLLKYAQKLKVDTAKWVFLTGRKDSLYQQARSSYLLDDPKNSVKNINDQFLHTQFFALVDKNGNVRGQIYDGLKEGDLKQLESDINTLLNERETKSHFANGIFTNDL
jgi:protein SCO1/2